MLVIDLVIEAIPEQFAVIVFYSRVRGSAYAQSFAHTSVTWVMLQLQLKIPWRIKHLPILSQCPKFMGFLLYRTAIVHSRLRSSPSLTHDPVHVSTYNIIVQTK